MSFGNIYQLGEDVVKIIEQEVQGERLTKRPWLSRLGMIKCGDACLAVRPSVGGGSRISTNPCKKNYPVCSI